MGIIEFIVEFVEILLFHALPPLLVAAVVGAVVGVSIAWIRMGLEQMAMRR